LLLQHDLYLKKHTMDPKPWVFSIMNCCHSVLEEYSWATTDLHAHELLLLEFAHHLHQAIHPQILRSLSFQECLNLDFPSPV
jgi:hypothetical protein